MRVYRFRNKKVAVLGFMMEGKALVRYLLKGKANVTVFDRKEREELDFDDIGVARINLVCGVNYLENGLEDYDIIFRSPGVYRYIPEIVGAEEKGVEISSEIKLFFDLCPGRIIGITGTKGKGTTATLIYNILKKSGKDVHLAGNIGITRLGLLPKLRKTSWVVLELSSFQLIDLEKSPHIAVVLNITSDHMDWHKDRKEYVDAKKNIVSHQGKDDHALVNYDYKDSGSFGRLSNGKVCYFSTKRKVNGCFVLNNQIILSINDKKEVIGSTNNLLIRGEHNWENVSAAVCASAFAGASTSSIKSVVFSFKGLKHRLELVGKVGGVGFYNDSFSTNPQTAIAAINSFTEPITLILGGFDKGLNYNKLAKVVREARNVVNVILIGDIAGKLKKALNSVKFKGKILELGKSTMDKIVSVAYKSTQNGGVVLLSPATSSFDMFENYKERGDKFKEAVKLLSSK